MSINKSSVNLNRGRRSNKQLCMNLGGTFWINGYSSKYFEFPFRDSYQQAVFIYGNEMISLLGLANDAGAEARMFITRMTINGGTVVGTLSSSYSMERVDSFYYKEGKIILNGYEAGYYRRLEYTISDGTFTYIDTAADTSGLALTNSLIYGGYAISTDHYVEVTYNYRGYRPLIKFISQ